MTSNVLNKGTPLFTIICSLRNNYQCFFEELLGHIVSQRYENYQCIFITDQKDVDWVKRPDERFEIINLSQEYSLAKKRNIGIENAKGEYIIFCDADDFLDENILFFFSKIIKRFQPDFILPKTTRKLDDLGKRNKCIVEESSFFDNKDLIIKSFFSRYLINGDNHVFILDGSWGRAFKRDIIINNNIRFLEKPCRAEDALFVNDFVLKTNSVYFASDYYGYYWRINSNSEMFNVNSFFFNIVPFVEKLSIQMNSVSKEYSKDFAYYVATLATSQIGDFCYALSKKKINKKEFKELLDKTAPKQTLCYKTMKKLSLKKSIKKKVICILYSMRLYSIIYLLFRLSFKNPALRRLD